MKFVLFGSDAKIRQQKKKHSDIDTSADTHTFFFSMTPLNVFNTRYIVVYQ